MGAITAIDADAHVDENYATWEYIEESERHLKPVGFDLSEGQSFTGSQARQADEGETAALPVGVAPGVASGAVVLAPAS